MTLKSDGKRASSSDQSISTSRRSFVTGAMSTAGGLAAIASGNLFAASASSDGNSPPLVPTLRVPKEIAESLSEAPIVPSFEGKGMLGADVFAKLCKDEGLAALFCAPGNYTVVHAMAAAGIPSYGGRTEGNMCAAADGFYRVSGEVAACSGTEGPGFAHMIQSIAAASFARTPLLVLASNQTIAGEDREAGLQHMDQQPITTGIKKFGKRLIVPERIYEYGAYAFRYLKSGVPGPVHLDFPAEVARARFTSSSTLTDYYDKHRYRTESVPAPDPKDVKKAIELIRKSERPILVAGHGVFHRKAWEPLRIAAEKNELGVVVSGPIRGHFPDDHRLSASSALAAIGSADLVIFVGQYSMPSHSDWIFNPEVKTIRVHPVAEDLGRNWPLDLGIVADEALFLRALADMLPSRKRPSWVSELAAARKAYDEEQDRFYVMGQRASRERGAVHPAIIGKVLHDFLYKGSIDPKEVVTGWGGFTCIRFVPPRMRAYRPGQMICCPYQFGAIGPDLPMMLGGAVATKEGVGVQQSYKGAPTLVLTTDAGMGFGLLELDTAVKYKIPLITVVYNNDCWGTWTFPAGLPRAVHLHLFQENIRYDRMAKELGCHGEYATTEEQLRAALARCYDIAAKEGLPSLINVRGVKEFSSAALYPPGAGLNPEPNIGAVAH